MTSETLSLLAYFLGLRGARSSVTGEEAALLVGLASRAKRAAEIGVHEGATSRRLAMALPRGAELYLVDPYLPRLKIERLLGTSLYEKVARREVRGAGARVVFVRESSRLAATSDRVPGGLDLVFLDGDHAYERVREDFELWSSKLAAGGALAFHDSRPRPGSGDPGGSAGPVRLLREIADGHFPAWRVAESAGTVSTVVRKVAVQAGA